MSSQAPSPVALRALVMLGAFLLFASEPLVGSLILPHAGGGVHVWATALMFFQAALIVGYLYSHWLAPRLGRWHVLVAALPLALMPLSISVEFDPSAPVLSVLAALTRHIAPAFVVLATTAVVAQSWLARASDRASSNPYPLYAFSNAGALVALASYPFAVAPLLSLRAQSWAWTAGYVVYVALLWRCAPARRVEALPTPQDDDHHQLTPARYASWLALSAAPSALLLAVTNVIEQDVGSAPLVWIVPLALYLASFVLVFRDRPLRLPLAGRFWPEIALVGLFLFFHRQAKLEWWVAAIHLIVLLLVSVEAHATLYRSRPPASKLTAFYLAIGVGGWLGSAFVVLAAPAVFNSFVEYPLAIVGVAVAIAIARRTELASFARRESRVLLVASALFVGFVVVEHVRTDESGAPAQKEGTLFVHRNAYGIYRVTWTGTPDIRTLHHGTTMHGWQNLDPIQRRRPLGYYAPESPLGDVMRLLSTPRRAAAVGLGAGTMAAYFERGDELTFYELDPDVVDIANRFFAYLHDCQATLRVVVGDGRVQLARAADDAGRLGAVIIDAFSSDAIPTHLLTREAIELFESKLAPNGYLVFHISNRHLDLRPVLRAVGDAVGMHGAYKERLTVVAPGETGSTYFVLVRDPALLDPLMAVGWTRADANSGLPRWKAWTDDHVDLLRPLLAH